MAYSAALNTVYNHYLTTYAPKTTGRYDSHKRSELRSIYNSIVKLNKESPLYLPETSEESQEFAVGLKESARQLHNTIASLGGLNRDELLNQKTAYSSNPALAEATFIGTISDGESIPSFELKVDALASNQVNTGNFLPASEETNLSEDTYSFDITVNDLSYEFQYNVRSGENNRQVQERLSRLISGADIGVKADVVEDGLGNSALRLSSASTGARPDGKMVFGISDENTSKEKGSVSYFGLDRMTLAPSNALFEINGEPRSASSNHFTVEKTYELTLTGVSSSDDDKAEISVKADVESLSENIQSLVEGYNSFMNAATSRNTEYPKSKHLVREMENIAMKYQQAFEKMGATFDDEGILSLDKDQLRNTILSGGGEESLDALKDFAESVLKKANDVSLNPMQYVEKTIVAYKHPGHNFATPYITSAYSGMMFNSYC